MTISTIMSIGFLGPLALFFMSFSVRGLLDSHKEGRLKTYVHRNGNLTYGQIISHRVLMRGRGTVYYVTYGYGNSYLQEQEVQRSHFESLQDGKYVAVCYLPHAPRVAMLGAQDLDDARMRRLRIVSACYLFVSLCVIGWAMAYLFVF